jgi:hypothetical protein
MEEVLQAMFKHKEASLSMKNVCETQKKKLSDYRQDNTNLVLDLKENEQTSK